MIFGYIENEPVVQHDDRTRLSSTKSFVSKDEAKITRVEISPFGSLVNFLGRRYTAAFTDYTAPGQFVLTVNQTLYTVPYTTQQNRLDELNDLVLVINSNELANNITASVVDEQLVLTSTGYSNEYSLILLEGMTQVETSVPGGFDPVVGGFVTVGEYSPTQTPKPSEWFLDWQYTASQVGPINVMVRITTDGEGVIFASPGLQVVTPATDLLWSSDQDLVLHEPDVLKWVPEGRSSFLNVHRKSQTAILEWLDAIRIHRSDGSRLMKQDLLVTTDVKELSTYYTLHFIYRGLQNKPDDVFALKAQDYMDLVLETKGRGRIQADMDQSLAIDSNEKRDLRSIRGVRR
jgi:hypothetical protein